MTHPLYVLTDADVRRIADEAARQAVEQFAGTIKRAHPDRPVLSTREAATYARRKPSTIRDWIKAGLPAENIEGSAGYRILKSDLDEWMASR